MASSAARVFIYGLPKAYILEPQALSAIRRETEGREHGPQPAFPRSRQVTELGCQEAGTDRSAGPRRRRRQRG